MNKERIIEDIKKETGIEVGLQYKTMYCGEKGNRSDKTRALHVEVNKIRSQHPLDILSNRYGQKEADGPGGRNIRLFPVWTKVKSLE